MRSGIALLAMPALASFAPAAGTPAPPRPLRRATFNISAGAAGADAAGAAVAGGLDASPLGDTDAASATTPTDEATSAPAVSEQVVAAATPSPAWPYTPLGGNGSFPSLWYGSNQSGFESPGQLRHDVRFSLLFFIWGVGMGGQANWTAQEAAFERQCHAVKAMSPQRPCLVYLDWGTTLGWYTAQAEAASDPSLQDIWLRDESGQRLGFTDCHDPHCPRDLLLDFRHPAAVDWWVERVVEPLIASDAVDGVFFDSVGLVGGCGDLLSAFCRANTTHCGSLVELPARRALYNGTINALARVSQLHAAYRKTPVYSLADYGPFEVFSEFETSPPSCVEPEEEIVDALSGLPWMRFYEVWPSHNAQTAVPGYCERNVRNALREAALGIPFAVHAFADGYPTPSRCARASKGAEGSVRKGWSTGRLLRPGNSSGAERGYPACRAECATDSRCVGFAAITPPSSGAPFCQLLNSITQTNSDERWLSWSKSATSDCSCSNPGAAASSPGCSLPEKPAISFSLAAFLVVYSPHYSYYSVSTGKLPYQDGDFPWHEEFDRSYGAPLEVATDHGNGTFRRRFQHVTVELNCRTGEADYHWTPRDPQRPTARQGQQDSTST